MLSAIVQRVLVHCGKYEEEKMFSRATKRTRQVSAAASSTTLLPPLLLLNLFASVSFIPKTLCSFQGFCSQPGETCSKVVIPVAKVGQRLSSAGWSRIQPQVEDSPMSVCTERPWLLSYLQRRFRLLLTHLFPMKLCCAHVLEVRISKACRSMMDCINLSWEISQFLSLTLMPHDESGGRYERSPSAPTCLTHFLQY